MKLWDKGQATNKLIETFTVGNDKIFDIRLAAYDIQGTLAHIKMLESINLLKKDELAKLEKELKAILKTIENGIFKIDNDVEDVHSQVELLLTKKLGNLGKKIHSARSRNDQVLVDMKLFLRAEIKKTAQLTNELFEALIKKSNEGKNILLPGYTHLQIAMPSSFGLWFGAYAESLTDDMHTLHAAYKIVNQNPLGSAAGYGSSFPINRTMTTRLLGFDDLNYNVVYAQMTRGKSEKITAQAMANIAATLGKMAMDVCLFMSQNFAFVTLPDEMTTGSSIMPHKKNPDVFELIRAKCNKIQALPNELTLLTSNLPSGYHRDLQLLKESIMPAIDELQACLIMATRMTNQLSLNKDILKDKKYSYLFSVEEVNKLVLQGIPFRDAYKQVGKEIEKGTFAPSTKINHTHEGSIGNLCNKEIRAKMQKIIKEFKL